MALTSPASGTTTATGASSTGAELAGVVGAPAGDVAGGRGRADVLDQRAGEGGAGRQLDHAGQGGRGDHGAEGVRHRSVAELAGVVGAPATDRRVGRRAGRR